MEEHKRRATDHIIINEKGLEPSFDKKDYERSDDSEWNPSAEINSHKMLYAIYNDVQILKTKLHNMDEMFTAWTNIKGFKTTIKWIGLTTLFISSVVGVLIAGWYSFKRAITGL